MTPAAVAARLGVGRGKVVAWIRAGVLVAVNLAQTTGPGKRDQWRVSPADLAAFEAVRSSRQDVPLPPSRRRSAAAKRTATNYIE